jgi:AraC-like DNA-binding protein
LEVFLNLGLGAGILMFLVLVFKQGKKREDYIFLAWIVVTLLQIVFYQITIYSFELQGLWAILSFGLPLMGAPLLFLYILALTGHKVTSYTVAKHLAAYFIFVIILLALQEISDVELIASNGYFPLSEKAPLWMQYYAIPLAISGLVYCIWDILLLRKHRKTIVTFFSFDEKVDLKWVTYIVYSYFILFLLSSFLIFGATQFQLFTISNAFAFVGIILSLMLIAFGFYGFRQTAVFSNLDTQNTPSIDLDSSKTETTSYSKSGLTEEKIISYANNIGEHMKHEKPYLQDDLTLSVLAEQCGLSNIHLSQILNQHFQLNFYDFVNQYRIEESKKMLLSSNYDNLSVLGIAFDCGFKSKSSFNRYFKKYNGMSPSEFKKRKS